MKRFIIAHRIAIIILAAAILSTAGLNGLLIASADSDLKEKQLASSKSLAAMDSTIAKLKTDKAKKAADDAARKKAAEEAESKQTTPAPPVPSRVSNSAHGDPSRIDVVVNKKHPITPLSYTPTLQTVSCAGNGSATIQVQAVNDFIALCNAAANAGQPLGVSSSYRSYQTQVSTYNYWVSVSGQAGADRYSARPGYSEHQTGYSVDLRVPGGPELSDFTGTSQQLWLAANAYTYGFIQRYTESNSGATGYQAESWHFRYIGRDVAMTYTTSGASSLESYWGVTGGDY